jgi:hypothetical protein
MSTRSSSGVCALETVAVVLRQATVCDGRICDGYYPPISQRFRDGFHHPLLFFRHLPSTLFEPANSGTHAHITGYSPRENALSRTTHHNTDDRQ